MNSPTDMVRIEASMVGQLLSRHAVWARLKAARGDHMSLKVIGAGFGRTGTHSLKIALEMLGFAPCYHMVEVFTHAGHSEAWEAAALGEKIDWEALLAGYQSAVDRPSSYFWRELLKMNPGAKVILT